MDRMSASAEIRSSLFAATDAARLTDGVANRMVLPMSRYDIADYLAVSVETVSRSLTDLRQRGMITLAGTRQIKIVNHDALELCGTDD